MHPAVRRGGRHCSSGPAGRAARAAGTRIGNAMLALHVMRTHMGLQLDRTVDEPRAPAARPCSRASYEHARRAHRRRRRAAPAAARRAGRERGADALLRGAARDVPRARLLPLLQPRRFGGLELDVATFYRVMMSIARGCPSTGWMLTSGPGTRCRSPRTGRRRRRRRSSATATSSRRRASRRRTRSRRRCRGGYRVQRHVALLLGRALRDAPHRPRPDCPDDGRRARRGDPAQGLHRPGRLGRPHRARRAAGRTASSSRTRSIPEHHAITLRGVRRVRRHHDPGLRAARQPDVRRRVRAVRDGRAQLGAGRQRAGGGRRVRAHHHRAQDVDAERRRRSRPLGEQGLPALPRARHRLHGRRVLDRRALRRALHRARARLAMERGRAGQTRSAGSGSTGSS